MKKIISFILIFVLAMSFSVNAQNDVKVTIDGVTVEFDVPPQIIDGRTLVPMRKIFECLGAQVSWIESDRSIIAIKGETIIGMTIDSAKMVVTNLISTKTQTVTLDVPPVIVDSRTLVPARAISESLGLKVDWDNDTRTVIILSK